MLIHYVVVFVPQFSTQRPFLNTEMFPYREPYVLPGVDSGGTEAFEMGLVSPFA